LIEGLIGMLGQLSSMMKTAGTEAGDLVHGVNQLRTAFQLAAQGYDTAVNVPMRILAQTADGQKLEILRILDVVAKRAGELDLHIEQKSGDIASAIPTLTQAFKKGEENLQLLGDLIAGASGNAKNLWQFTEEAGPREQAILEKRLTTYAQFMMEGLGATEAQVRRAFESFKLSAADQIFEPALEFIFGPEGTIAKVALRKATGSPDFNPAMEAILGPTGKLANAATQAAEGANFTTAQTDLEQKVEKSVTTALEGAGTAAADKAGTKVGEKVAGGLTALGNVLTSIPQLYSGVKSLGEAWDKPNKNAGDYMTIMSSLGGVVMGVGQTIQAFSAIQEIATGVQAAFNAVAAMNPYVLIALAVIALIAGIVLLIVYWDKVKAAIRDNPWIAVIAVMFGVIGVIILVIAYWDEIKLAVLKAANFVSIQMQRVGGFFIGVKNLAGMVWGWIVATVENVGIGILNAFITIGVGIQNFFIGVINWVLKQYNKVADSAIGSVLGLSKAALLPEVDVKTKLIPPKEVPKVDVEAAFKPMTEEKTGGLEGQIAKQQGVVDKAKKDDEDRRAKEAKEKADKEKAAAAPPGAPAGLAPPAIPGMPPGAPGVPAAFARPPGAAAAAPAAPGGGGVTIQGGITVTINADKLEADASKMLSDEIVQALNTKLQALQGDANRRLGVAAA
jgi:hypothetical protein